MKINRGAVLFVAILGGLILIIVAIITVSNLLRQSPGAGTEDVGDLFSSLFPFGQGVVRQPGSGATGGEETPSGPVPALREISKDPVAGFRIASSSAILYVEQSTGHIFETHVDSLEVVRRANTTFSGIRQAVWVSDNSVIYQSTDGLRSIQNFMMSFSTTSVDQRIDGRQMSGFSAVAVAPQQQALILTRATGLTTAITLSDYGETQRQVIFSSPLQSLRALPVGDDVFIETSPSDSPGFLYRALAGGGLEKIRGNAPGLMAVANSAGTYVALSTANGEKVELSFVDRTGASVGTSPVGTFAEKCAWLNAAPLLVCGIPQSLAGASVEAWYMGFQSFNDDVWIIDPIKETGTFVKNLAEEAGRPIDIVDPQISPDGRYFLFKNKNDLSLWSLDLAR